MYSTTYETVKFSCAIWGYQVYRNTRQPKEKETLQCGHESNNNYDLFATKICQDTEFYPQIMGHLPLEISIEDIKDCHYRRSPLLQESLEIPCVVNAKLIGTKKNKEILTKYLEIVQNHYIEPSSDEDVIMGSFLAMNVNEDATTANHKDCTKCPNKGVKTNHWKM